MATFNKHQSDYYEEEFELEGSDIYEDYEDYEQCALDVVEESEGEDDYYDDIETIDEPDSDEDVDQDDDENEELDYIKVMSDYHSNDPIKVNKALNMVYEDKKELVHHIIRKKFPTYATNDRYEDLVQQGLLGMYKALAKYDPAKAKASTYFYPYIFGEIQEYVTKFIRGTTSHYSASEKKIKKVMDEYEQRGEPYTSVDIALQTGLPIQTIDTTITMFRNSKTLVSIEANPMDVIDGMVDHSTSKSPSDEYIEKEEMEVLYAAMHKSLSKLEIQVLELRDGLNGKQALSIKEISLKLGITQELVKKLRATSLVKLKNSPLLAKMNRENFQNEFEALREDNGIQLSPMDHANITLTILKDVEIDF